MEITPVDPRDTSWEITTPVYRVYLWHGESKASDEYEIADANSVQDVFAWADARVRESASSTTYTVYVVAKDSDSRQGLICIYGSDNGPGAGPPTTLRLDYPEN
jgi:hypothetical protein